VIRRGFWLTLGAVIGVTGYRRAARLARSVLPAAISQGQLTHARRGARALSAGEDRAPKDRALSRGGTRREQDYDRGRELPGREELGRRALAAAASAGRSAAASAAFVRDVRDGMAEYLNRHEARPPRSLKDSQGRQEPGAGPAGPAPMPARDGVPGSRRREAR
jgi:fermentation-respiration switch protein FrsA (DUF1100 family)